MKSCLLFLILAFSVKANTSDQSKKPSFYLKGNRNQSTIYLGVDNYLRLYEDNDCNSVSFRTDNGVITTQSDNCEITLAPKQEGECKVEVLDKRSGKLLSTQVFDVSSLPKPEIYLASKSNGAIPLKNLTVLRGLRLIQLSSLFKTNMA